MDSHAFTFHEVFYIAIAQLPLSLTCTISSCLRHTIFCQHINSTKIILAKQELARTVA